MFLTVPLRTALNSNKNIYIYHIGVFAKTNPQLDFNPKPIPKLESNTKLT